MPRGTLGGLSVNVLAADSHSALARRALTPTDSAVNHDIIRAVGEAIKLILKALATEDVGTGSCGTGMRM